MPTGKVAGAKIWHVYRYPQVPGNLLALGSILSDHEDPQSSLNLDDGLIPVPSDKIYSDSEVDRRTLEEELSKSNHLLLSLAPSAFLPDFKAGVDGKQSKSTNNTIEALKVRTKWFRPSDHYMELALQNQSVKDFVRRCLFTKSLYIITGVATASKLTVKEKSEDSNAVATSLNTSLPGIGSKVEGKMSHDKKESSALGFEVVEDCDFAYTVREFIYSRRSGKLRAKDHSTKGAMFAGGYDPDDFDSDSDDEDIDEDLKPIPHFEYFKDVD